MKKFGGLLLLLALAACAGSEIPAAPKEEAPAKVAVPKIKTDDLICPQVAILRDLQEAFDYGGENPDPSQLVAKAHLIKIDGDCAYTKDGIDITFKLHAAAARGPRLGGDQVGFPYFIAIVDPAESIVSRQIITAQFKFSGSKQVATLDEPLHVFIPLAESAVTAGPDYRVLVGFKQPAKDQK